MKFDLAFDSIYTNCINLLIIMFLLNLKTFIIYPNSALDGN